MEILSLEKFFQKEGTTINANYTTIGKDTTAQKKAVESLSIYTGIPTDELTQSLHDDIALIGMFYWIALIISVILASIFFVTNIFYPITKLKEIGVLKLLGYSNIKIWMELNASLFLVPFGFVILSLILQRTFIQDSTFQYFFILFIFQLLVFVACFLISSICE
ncbi:MAG: hypothetical protein ACK5KR_02575 [Breznakia sp.]